MGLLITFILLALIFGVGGVLKGLAWALLIAAALLLVAVLAGVQKLRSSF
jgi:hypothetical protein